MCRLSALHYMVIFFNERESAIDYQVIQSSTRQPVVRLQDLDSDELLEYARINKALTVWSSDMSQPYPIAQDADALSDYRED